MGAAQQSSEEIAALVPNPDVGRAQRSQALAPSCSEEALVSPIKFPSPRSSWEGPASPLLLAACPQIPGTPSTWAHWPSLIIPPPCGGDPQPSAPSPDAPLFFPKLFWPRPPPGLTRSAELAPWSRPWLCLLGPGAWGPGRACGSGTGGSACTRILILVELSTVQAQLSAEVGAAPDPGTGSLCGALCFPGQVPVPTCVLTHRSNRQSSWTQWCQWPFAAAEHRPSCFRVPEALVGARWGGSWDLCAQGGRQVPFLATGERRGIWQEWAVRLACAQQRGCQGTGHKQLYLQAVGAITELATRGQCFPGASRAKLRPQWD